MLSGRFSQFVSLGLIGVVLALGAGLIVTQIERSRLMEVRTWDFMRLWQLVRGCQAAQDLHRAFPPAFDKFAKMEFPASLHVHLLPFLDQAETYDDYITQTGKGDAENRVIPTYISVAEEESILTGTQNFAANLRVFSDNARDCSWRADISHVREIEPGSASVPVSFPDGTACTILFATKFAQCGDGGARYAAPPNSIFGSYFGEWVAQTSADSSSSRAAYQLAPAPWQCLCTPLIAQSFSTEGILVSCADASCRVVSPNISPEVWNRALQPNDGIPLREGWWGE